MLYKKKITYYLLLGLLIRLLIIPFFTHLDLSAIYEMSHYFGLHGIWDVYTVIYNNYYHWLAVYPPLTFFSFGSYLFLVKGLLPLFDIGPHFDFNTTIYPSWVTSIYAFRYLIILKFPYLLFDLGLGLILTSFFDEAEKKIKVLKLWIFCPITLYVSFIYGHYDIIPTFLVILSILLIKKQKNYLSFLVLGIAIAYKTYPIFFILPAIIICGGDIWKILKNLLLSILPYTLSILPFIKNISFRDPVLYNSFTSYFFNSELPIGQGDSLVPFFIIYALIVIYFLVNKRKNEDLSYQTLILSYSLILLAFFSLIYFHPQWLIWLMPFLIIYLANNLKLTYIYWLIIILFIPHLFRSSSSTTWYLLDVINLDFFHYLKPPKQIISQFYNADYFLTISRSFLSAALISFAFIISRSKNGLYEDN